MTLKDSQIQLDGFEMQSKHEKKLSTCINNLRSTLPVSDLKIKFVKTGQVFEGMVWCQAFGVPLGSYNRHVSMAQLIESLFKKLNRECRRAMKLSYKIPAQKTYQSSCSEKNYELAG